MSLELIVLGASGTYPTKDSATTGYLVRDGKSSVWLDAGTGTFANLQRHMDFFDLDKIVLTHLHLDHVLDLYPLYYALRYSPGSRGPQGIGVLAPAGAEDHLRRLLNDNGDCDFGGYLKFSPIEDGSDASVGDLRFTFAKTVHPVVTLATRVSLDGKSLVITSDTAPSDQVVSLAKDVDVLIAEASLQEVNESLKSVHMTAEEAGKMAAAAGAKQLILTHLTPGLDPDVSIAQARQHYEGRIQVAHDNLKIEV